MASRRKYGLFTEIQLTALYYKSHGYSLREIAEIHGSSHQNISIAYKRALKNKEIAEKTLFYYNLITSCIQLIIPAGTKLVDIPKLVFDKCDTKGIKLRADVTLIFKTIRFKHRECLEGNMLKKPLLVLIDHKGELNIYSYDKIKDEYIKLLEFTRILEEKSMKAAGGT